ncbi:adenosylcobinamide-GDP ribazoletransferase [Luteithermobacter gelatinilyticus]|uniref:adenosylcobinamide-GDP ribazoletransferase n=1 Tax=Luteithermobacter gelatinilyticus TaxID=2582913 RepID=UPI001AEF43B1|nr:adenosylcobinamide-GDP ribazoletransferase [Luteithermobacter gelatinilyticus]
MTDTPNRTAGVKADLRMVGEDVAAALMLLTRIPVPWHRISDSPPDLNRALWAYPVVGLVISGLGAAVFLGASAVSLPPLVAALLALLAMVLGTGAFHEDGLADVADGFGGGQDKARKLEIMKDSRIGTYGTVAVVLSLGLRAGALSAFTPLAAGTALLVAGCFSRLMIVVVLRLMPPAYEGGMGTVAGRPTSGRLLMAVMIAAGSGLLLLPVSAFLAAVLAAGVGAGLMAEIARRQIAGYTGDVLGAVQQVAEILVLLTLISYGEVIP